MSANTVGIIGIIFLIVLLFGRMYIGAAMLLVGFLGYSFIQGFSAGVGTLATVPYSAIADYTITVVPLFILMGNVASNTGICEDLYKSAHKWFGQLPGGLAIGTVTASALFAAVCGSSLAANVTLGTIAVPEMKKYKYNDGLATGCVAAGSTLGVLIPPSLGFILYAILTEESVGLLFMAGVIPGIFLAVVFIVTIYLNCKIDPTYGPVGSQSTLIEKIKSLRYVGAMLAIFIFVMGGIYAGVFTPYEAGALGSFGAIVITAIGRRLTWQSLARSFVEAGMVTGMIIILIMGAFIFMRFLAVSKLPFMISDFVAGLEMSRYLIFAIIILFYILLGMFLDIMACIILTIPVIFPTVTGLGFDPIWFGVIVVIVIEMGLITPPVGMNVFILAGISKIPINIIFRGVVPFVIVMILTIIVLTIFPQIAMFLPNLMK